MVSQKLGVRWETLLWLSAILILCVTANFLLTVKIAAHTQTEFDETTSNSSLSALRSSVWEQIGSVLPSELTLWNQQENVTNNNDTSRPEQNENTDAFIQDKFTIVVNTFRNRDESVLALLKYYAKCQEDRPDTFHLDRMVVIWNDIERPIPPFFSEYAESYVNERSEGLVFVEVQNSTNLTNRFRLQPSIRTEAIYSTDDDEFFVCYAVEYAFEVWRENPLQRMVGFAPRKLAMPTVKANMRHVSSYYAWDAAFKERAYDSLFVTKGGFLHRRFYQAFHEDERLNEVRDFVDEHTTGEDILMAVCHAMHARELPNMTAVVELSTSDADAIKHSDEATSAEEEQKAVVVAFALQKDMHLIQDQLGRLSTISLGRRTKEHRGTVFQLLCDSLSRQGVFPKLGRSCWLPVLMGNTNNQWCIIEPNTTHVCQIPLPQVRWWIV